MVSVIVGRTVTRSSRNDNEDVAGVASEAFAVWLHHRYAPVELVGQVLNFYLSGHVCLISLHPI